MAASDVSGRMATSIFGQDPLPPSFTACKDVPRGGVLFAIPALVVSGLLKHCGQYFQHLKGFYSLGCIFLLLAFMALVRIKVVEVLRYNPPGEWGKLLGLDRIPEVKTLREKIKVLSQNGEPQQWAGELSRDWMSMEPDLAGVLYIDGHVQVYHGKQTELPRHYVSRQKLCLRVTTDYWVNAMDGRPFFVINEAIDPGLLQVLEEEIVPRLENEVPSQPDPVELERDLHKHRFTLIFDREGYSPAFMKRMWQRGIACLTYHKYPGDDWPEEEFHKQSVTLVSGNVVEMKLAERGVLLGEELWVREIRKLRKNGKQTSILSTDYQTDYGPAAAMMFARWSQENFLKYMRQNYNIDALVNYSLEDICDTARIVNPLYKDVDRDVQKCTGQLNRKRQNFAKIVSHEEAKSDNHEEYQTKKTELQAEIASLEKLVEELKDCRKNTPKHVTMGDLPEEDRFKRLDTRARYLIDAIKMIAYRAETAMVGIIREEMSRGADDAHALLRAIYANEADILPDYEKKILRVRLHQLANQSSAKTIQHLCNELNATKTVFPGTDMLLVYELVS